MPLVPEAGFCCECGSDTFKLETHVRFHTKLMDLVDKTTKVAICVECGKTYPLYIDTTIRSTEDL